MKTKSLLLKVLLLIFIAAATCMSLIGCAGDQNAEPPTLNVTGVPSEGTVGRVISLPAATAADSDGKDISANCKVTVTRLNQDGSDKDDMINARPANVPQTFTPTGNDFLNYKIVYYVRNDAGVKVEKKFDFKATVDTEKPAMSFVKEGEFASFDESEGLQGRAGESLSLPKVTAVKSDGFDASSYAQVTIYTADGEKTVTSSLSAANVQTVRLIPGTYKAVYSLTDASGNTADELEFPLTIGLPDLSENLLFDRDNFVTGYDTRFNEYGELEIGKTSGGDQSDNPTSATMSLMKLHGETVAVSFTADPYVSGGNTLFDISFIGTKSRDRFAPDGTEGMWSPYFVLRITENGSINFRVASVANNGAGTDFSVQKAYNGNLRDGLHHVVYIRFEFEEARATAKLWVDVTPDNETSYEGIVERGQEHANGKIPAEIFDELKDSQTGAGWLCFGGAAMKGVDPDTGKYGDSIMRVGGVAVYPAGTTSYDVDILPPEMTFSALPPSRIILDTDYALEKPALSDGSLKTYMTRPDGTRAEFNSTTYKFSEIGTYTLTFVATDRAGNVSYRSFAIVCHKKDTTAPVFTVKKDAIDLVAGESLIVPAAMASDDTDGDITDRITVSLEGPFRASNVSGSIAVMAAGTHTLVYTVSDLAGNRATERVQVNVSTAFSDKVNYLEQMAGDSLTVENMGVFDYMRQYVYNEKVSYRIRFSKFTGVNIVQFNLRGSSHDSGDSKSWMSGMVLRLIGDKIEVSANKHDQYVFGSAKNPFVLDYWCDTDVVFEYRLSDVTIGQTDYLKFELWINGTKVEMTPESKAMKDAAGDLVLPVSVFGSEVPAENMSAGPIRFSAQNGYAGFTITEIAVDKTFTEYPQDPEPPAPEGVLLEELNLPAALPSADTAIKNINSEGEPVKMVGSAAGYVVSFRMNILSVGSLDSLVLTLSGTPTNCWGHGAGLTLTYRRDNAWCLTFGGRNDDFLARFWTPELEIGKDYCFAVRVGYAASEADSRVLDKITVEFWFGESADAMSPVALVGSESTVYAVDAATAEGWGISAISSQGIYAGSPLQGTNYTLQVTEVSEQAPAAPAVQGILMSELNLPSAAPAADTAEKTIVGGEDANKLADSFGGYTAYLKTSVLAKGTNDSLVLTLSGLPTNCWGHGAGLTLTYRDDSAWCVTFGGRNDEFLARFWTPALETGKDYYFAVRVGYEANEADSRVLGKMTVEFWFGESADAMQQIKLLNSENTAFEIDAATAEAWGVSAIASQGLYAGSPFAGTDYKLELIEIR